MTLAEKWMLEGEMRGERKGKIEGKIEEKLEVAQRMLEEGVEIAFIAKITQLSGTEIQKLQARMMTENV